MKKIFTLFVVTASIVMSACAQNPKPSPAAKAEGKAGDANITINYGQPSMKGRKIFGECCPVSWFDGSMVKRRDKQKEKR